MVDLVGQYLSVLAPDHEVVSVNYLKSSDRGAVINPRARKKLLDVIGHDPPDFYF